MKQKLLIACLLAFWGSLPVEAKAPAAKPIMTEAQAMQILDLAFEHYKKFSHEISYEVSKIGSPMFFAESRKWFDMLIGPGVDMGYVIEIEDATGRCRVTPMMNTPWTHFSVVPGVKAILKKPKSR